MASKIIANNDNGNIMMPPVFKKTKILFIGRVLKY